MVYTIGKNTFLLDSTKKSDIFMFLVTVSRQNKQSGHFLKNPNLGQEKHDSDPKYGGYRTLKGHSTKTI